ncbi:Aminoacylase-1 [Gryllus bimaculatus]|nr:Aminoacylase-1 [Gryllus bimaculatus]
MARSEADLDEQAVNALRDYLRIPSVHPNVDYGPCEQWIRAQAASIGLPVRVARPAAPHKPVVIVTWAGARPSLPAVLLNSHMDVVPVYQEKWTHPPFGAERTEDGKIYARGSQDMKSNAVQYLEAVRRLRLEGFQPQRTVHITFVPDEEIGGVDGMEAFVKTETFAELNVGFAMDEGMAWPGDEIVIFNGERSNWKLEFICRGNPGHGSMLMDNPAAQRVRVILDRLLDYRESEKARLKHPLMDQGKVTCVNVTMLQGGVQNNVVPPEITIVADVRISPEKDHDEFVKMVQGWCDEAGDTELRIVQRGEVEGVTELNQSNKWWLALKSALENANEKIIPIICPGGTDARFIRRLKIPAIGMCVLNNTPILLHDHDEFIYEKVFLKGISLFEEIIRNLTAV